MQPDYFQRQKDGRNTGSFAGETGKYGSFSNVWKAWFKKDLYPVVSDEILAGIEKNIWLDLNQEGSSLRTAFFTFSKQNEDKWHETLHYITDELVAKFFMGEFRKKGTPVWKIVKYDIYQFTRGYLDEKKNELNDRHEQCGKE